MPNWSVEGADTAKPSSKPPMPKMWAKDVEREEGRRQVRRSSIFMLLFYGIVWYNNGGD